MLTPEQIDQLAAELQQSEATRTAVEHFSRRHPGMTIEDGYRISRAWVARQLGEGRRVIGHKIGLTSRAMQISSQIDEPDYGTLLDRMLFTATPGQVLEIPAHRFIAPRVEVELAFILGKPLPVERQGMLLDIPACLVVSAGALIPALVQGKFKRWVGFFIGALYIAYLVIMFTCFGA